jgi:DNA polymerase IV
VDLRNVTSPNASRPEARKFGVRSALPAVRAERMCPTAVFLGPDFLRYRAASRQIPEIFERHTDLIAPLSLDPANREDTPVKIDVAKTNILYYSMLY